ncbi:FecR domain-containing protein [Mucilaginibacter sp. PAMB04274]|uniref:FecR family protein n=1 Tax=Mucilaginibacter sp. PAMB04274 TaxID=3138568 RepID=UPI0031F700B6
MENEDFKDLLKKFKEGTCTDEEKAMIAYWVHHLNQQGDSGLSEQDMMEAHDQMWDNIKPVKKLTRRFYWPAAAAVLAFAMLGLAAHFLLNNVANKASNANKVSVTSKIKPGGNNAVLILANGTQIILNQASNGQIAHQAGIRISKQADGQLIYSVAGNFTQADSSELAYNTLQTPRGGQYQINLPDGSKVWLNAASSLRFPLRFNTKQRMVELSGEGYFEVAHVNAPGGKRLPFTVKTISPVAGQNGQLVEVLGTHFNVNAYDDESVVKTTLLEGSVRVRQLSPNQQANASYAMLKPGEQSVLSNGGFTVVPTDTEAAIAWKNGYFRFNDESLESIMRKVSKWYDIDVAYQNEALKKKLFAGVTTRFANVTELLKMLELTGEVKFKIEGRKIQAFDKKN